jgi:tRNA-uridine 2-sulfurtransferase
MELPEKKTKALVLMSGGLDSILAAKILEEQGIAITPVCFKSHFFSCEAAKKAARQIGIGLRVEDISREHLGVVKKPRYGYGAGINPCIDCHLLMLATAKEIMEAEGYDFIATGEVLGERPMSQNRQALDTIEREAGLTGKLLRPLSAKLLPMTVVEEQGSVDRDKLCGISGRTRGTQYALAAHFGIKEIPQPGGGCILTEPEYGRRVRKLISVKPDFEASDAQLLRYCRPVWEGKILLAIARDKNDGEALVKLIKGGDIFLEPANFSGPVVIGRDFDSGMPRGEVTALGKKYLLQYSKKIPKKPEISVNNVQR